MSRWRSWDARRREAGPWHERHDGPDGTKRIAWRDATGRPGLGGHCLEDLVYVARDGWAAPTLAGATIVVVEGERCADAVAEAGYMAAGTVCGASSTPGTAVIALLADARVVLWPDADDVGRAHMERIGRALEWARVRSLSVIRPPDALPAGWDAADAEPGVIRDLVESALGRPVWVAA
jgi:hypothetical protein